MTTIASARVAIVLVNWNGWRDAAECLSSIFASDATPTADVYLVDNASTDGSIGHLSTWCSNPRPVGPYAVFDGVRHCGPEAIEFRIWKANGGPAPQHPNVRLTLVESGGNLGFAGGNNVGVVAAGLQRYTHFWLLNTDTVIRHDALTRLVERACAKPAVGIVGSTLRYYREPHLVQALGGATLDERTGIASHIGDRTPVDLVPIDGKVVESTMAYVVGASMLATSQFIERVGLMQEDYFLYYEEADWAFRGRPDFALGYAPASVVFHKVGASSTQVMSDYSLDVLYRSRVRFISRFLPGSLSSVRGMLAFEALRHVVKGRWTPARLAAKTLRDSRLLAASAPPIAPFGK